MVLFLTVIVGVYLTVLIANMGGYVDKIQRAQIREEIQQKVLGNPSFKSMSAEERNQMMEEMAALQEKRLGSRPAICHPQFSLSDKCPDPQPGLDTEYDQ